MTEADAKNGFGAGNKNLAQLGDCFFAFGWIARAVADEETIVLRWIKFVIPRHQVDTGTSSKKTTKLVIFETAIHSTDAGTAFRIESFNRLNDK